MSNIKNLNKCPKIFILHGATCVGKSTINRLIKDLFIDFNTIESESKIYYQKESAKEKLIEYKEELTKVINEIGNTNILESFNTFVPGEFLCVVDFLKRVIISRNMNCSASFTCSRLPLPDSTSILFYENIGKLCQVEIIHILVKCKNLNRYKNRLRKKNRHDCNDTPKYISNYNERLQNANYYDYVINSPREYIDILNCYNMKRIGLIPFNFYLITRIIGLQVDEIKRRYYASRIIGILYKILKIYKKHLIKLLNNLKIKC